MSEADEAERRLVDPISSHPRFEQIESRVAVGGHPVHAMLVAFPIALSVSALGADLFYWWTGDPFWTRAALWSLGAAFLVGVIAGLSGTVELLIVPGIRARASSWTHFVVAMTLLSILGTNWGYRLSAPEHAVLPLGVLLSLLGVGFTGFAGWHGGKLVFTYQVGTSGSGN